MSGRSQRQRCSRVERFFQALILSEASLALEYIKKDGKDSCYVMGTNSRAARSIFDENKEFRALEFVRTDRGVWTHSTNAASLPLGCLSRPAWVRRLRTITVLPPPKVGAPWMWKDRVLNNHVLVCLDFSAEENTMGIMTRLSQIAPTEVRVQAEGGDNSIEENLGVVLPEVSREQRCEIVLETDVEDARSIRQLEGVPCCSTEHPRSRQSPDHSGRSACASGRGDSEQYFMGGIEHSCSERGPLIPDR